MKILIVEDNATDIDLLNRELIKAEFSFESQVVETRESFEHALINYAPDIILSDFSLPIFNGIAALKMSQDICPDVPFIIVSGTIGEENAVELIKNGLTDYVLKDKLFSLPAKVVRALKEATEAKTKKIMDEKLKIQYEKLWEIAYMQSHHVRVPVTHILGLFSLFNYNNPADPINGEILAKMKTIADSLDTVIHKIVKKTSEIQALS
ncbi:hypothetical protein BH11BAC7_BH11BAC7_10990 [soil metagenome]